MEFLNVPMTVLRRTKRFFKEIRKKIQIKPKIKSLLSANAVFFAIYGCIIGAFSGLPQAMSSAVKLPLLFMLTLIVSFPTLYIINLLQGSRNTIGQYFALILGSTAVTSVLLLGFAPITILFMITSDHYQFFKILNVLLFTFAGFAGMKFFYRGVQSIEESPQNELLTEGSAAEEKQPQAIDNIDITDAAALDSAGEIDEADEDGKIEVAEDSIRAFLPESRRDEEVYFDDDFDDDYDEDEDQGHVRNKPRYPLTPAQKRALGRRRTLRVWVMLYGLVGSQLAWVLRPFFGAPGEEFEIFRTIDGNFFTNIIDALARIFGFK